MGTEIKETTNYFMKKCIAITIVLFFNSGSFAQNWENRWLQKIHVERNVSQQHFYINVTNSVKPIVLLSATTELIVGYATKNNEVVKNAYTSCASILGNFIVTSLLKEAIKRERPYVNNPNFTPYKILTDYSFPSGHSSNAFVVAGNLSFSYKKWYVVVPSYLWASIAAYSRMYLGEHYPTDIIAGAIIGTASAYIGHRLKNKIFSKKIPKKLLYNND